MSARGPAVLAVAALLALGAAAAAEPLRLRPGMGGLADPGAVTCGYLNGLYEGGPTGFRQMLLYWAEGYIYGKSGQALDEVLATAPGGPWTFDSLTDRLVGFCAASPDARVPAAAEALWRVLRPAR
jgi:hypothetical protein